MSSSHSDEESEGRHLMDLFSMDNESNSNIQPNSLSPGDIDSATQAYSSHPVEIVSRNSPATINEDVEEQEDSEEFYPNPALERILTSDSDAVSEYSGTIMGVRSSALTQVVQPNKQTSRTVPKPSTSALLNEDEAVGDDWLIEDVKSSRQKHTNIDSVFTTRGTRNRKLCDSLDEKPAFKR